MAFHTQYKAKCFGDILFVVCSRGCFTIPLLEHAQPAKKCIRTSTMIATELNVDGVTYIKPSVVCGILLLKLLRMHCSSDVWSSAGPGL